jgi:hypothetical protein
VQFVNRFSTNVKEKLIAFINEMAKSPDLFVKNPGKNFTRNRKLNFGTMMLLIISMGGNSIKKELMEFLAYDTNLPTTSAFVQQRGKILKFAFEYLFQQFTNSFSYSKLFIGYRLLAVDGSELLIARNPDDPDTYYQTKPDQKGYNSILLNAMFDLLNRIYTDIIIQPSKLKNENAALRNMVDRSKVKGKVIIVADRYFEGYNNFAHIIERGWNFVIRVKDITSKCGILSGLDLPKCGEFDAHINLILTRKSTKLIKAQPERYKHLGKQSKFDYLDLHTNLYYPISFRVIRIKLENGTYESIITNLDERKFPPALIKEIYKLRWGVETSFRQLKYTIGLTSFHAKKREHIIQEIFARCIMYNFVEIITSHVVISQKDTKHIYQVNFTVAVYACRHFLQLRSNAPPLDIEALISKNILPIRPDRKFKRKLLNKQAVSFLYRVA